MHLHSFKSAAENAWAIVRAFGYTNIQEDLAGQNIHSLANVLTLDHAIHNLFDLLKLWLEPTVRIFLLFSTEFDHGRIFPIVTKSEHPVLRWSLEQ